MTAGKLLRLGDDLALPIEIVTRRSLIVGQTDTGKTSTAVVLVEEARRRGVQVAVIDPSGAWYGVTSSADGRAPGLDMIVMGGEHGEIPLNDTAGRSVARLVAEHGISPVLDLDRPHFRSWAARQRFVADFLSELYEVVRGHVLIVIDEAHRFAPQSVRDEGDHSARCLGAVIDAVALGRRRGLSVVVITQRLAKLHKDVVELCEILIAHRLRGNNDLAQLRGWVEGVGEDWKAIRAQVVGLERGVARVSAPTMGVEGIYRIRPKDTFDSSRTIAPGEVAIVPTHRAEADLAALRDLMATTIAEAEADDPGKLREQIAALQAQVAELAGADRDAGEALYDAEAARADRNMSRSELDDIAELLGFARDTLSDDHGAVLAAVRAVRDRPTLGDGPRAELRVRFHNADERANHVEIALQQLRGEVNRLGATLFDVGVDLDLAPEPQSAPQPPERPPPAEHKPPPRARAQARPQPPERGESAGGGDLVASAGRGDLVAGARRMLDVLRRYPALTRAELAALALSYGGSMRNNLAALRAQGLVDEDDGAVRLTPAGLKLAGGHADPLTTDEIVAAHLAVKSGKNALVAGARRVLDVVLRAPDRGYTRSELERLADSRGGSFRNNLSALKRRGLVEERARRVYPGHVLYADRITTT